MGTMSEEQARELGRRAVACDGWRWLQGMEARREQYPHRLVCVEGDPETWCPPVWQHERPPDLLTNVRDPVPDLRDPCTVGGLLALVREAWGSSMVWAMADNTGCGWWVESWDADVPALIYATEAEALVAALEGAP